MTGLLGAETVRMASAKREGLTTLMARTVVTLGVAGALNTPPAVTEPAPATTAHTTEVVAEPVTVAVSCSDSPVNSTSLVGHIDTSTSGSVVTHWPETQETVASGPGAGQTTHAAPQAWTLSSAKHCPPHSWKPV